MVETFFEVYQICSYNDHQHYCYFISLEQHNKKTAKCNKFSQRMTDFVKYNYHLVVHIVAFSIVRDVRQTSIMVFFQVRLPVAGRQLWPTILEVPPSGYSGGTSQSLNSQILMTVNLFLLSPQKSDYQMYTSL